ncbi:uncharacterized protein BDZ99DRAFT_516539 [Mytilinidion resinicola]|uniref:Uncharacterized protein n=1 Tax=Mytilinidion resinicola TaxID=574789 RepID=A0A6A6YY84_9PEZI|nr:uncharacterized protein BDZ99DRAFT_516539 [Mytilinidion resinicola]KAF2813906.1 hypothetical protein BDZ99DRAFT_516539 [Mytilinidion resinicola]
MTLLRRCIGGDSPIGISTQGARGCAARAQGVEAGAILPSGDLIGLRQALGPSVPAAGRPCLSVSTAQWPQAVSSRPVTAGPAPPTATRMRAAKRKEEIFRCRAEVQRRGGGCEGDENTLSGPSHASGSARVVECRADDLAKAAVFAAGDQGAGENMAPRFKMLRVVGKATRKPNTFLCRGSTRQQSRCANHRSHIPALRHFCGVWVRCEVGSEQTDGLSASPSIASPVVDIDVVCSTWPADSPIRHATIHQRMQVVGRLQISPPLQHVLPRCWR